MPHPDMDPYVKEMIERKVEDAFRKNGTPVTLTMPSGEYEFGLIIGGVNEEFQYSREEGFQFLRTRGIFVVGSSLGGWAMPVPERMYASYIVLQLRACIAQRRYGYGRRLYKGEVDDWMCNDTAREPCVHLYKEQN